MEKLSELLSTGVYETLSPTKRMTVSELLKELGLEDNYLGVLVDGKKVSLDTLITPQTKLTILPNIAGG